MVGKRPGQENTPELQGWKRTARNACLDSNGSGHQRKWNIQRGKQTKCILHRMVKEGEERRWNREDGGWIDGWVGDGWRGEEKSNSGSGRFEDGR